MTKEKPSETRVEIIVNVKLLYVIRIKVLEKNILLISIDTEFK